MKKIININLSGRVIPIEDAAYESLQRYIESLRRYFAAEEGRDEIINDIESRIAELMNEKVKKGAAAVTEADMETIINTMGRVEDFAEVDSEPAPAAGPTPGADANTGSQRVFNADAPFRNRGRLYRDTNDKIVGGVCSGIAHYFGIDPAIVRIVLLLLVFGAGTGIFLYLLLWIIVPKRPLEPSVAKRFFRNPDDKLISGVAGGIAAYFNKDAWTIRLIFLAPILLNIVFEVLGAIFNYGNHRFFYPGLFVGSFTGTFVLAYIVLWIILPEARTPFEKMEMRGENVDVQKIRENVKTRAQEFGEEVKASAATLGARASEFANTRGREFAREVGQTTRPIARTFGSIIAFLVKGFVLFIVGIVALSFFIALIAVLFSGAGDIANTFLLENKTQIFTGWVGFLLLFGVPFVGIITWVVRRVMRVRQHNRYLSWTFTGLWLIGLLFSGFFVGSVINGFRYSGKTTSEVPVAPGINRMLVQVNEPAIRYSGNYSFIHSDGDETGWDISDDSLKISNVHVLVEKSFDSGYHVRVERVASGKFRTEAQQRAEKMHYNVSATDSVLNLGSGFAVSKEDKFRNQRVFVRILVPVGKELRFDQTVIDRLNPVKVHINGTETYPKRSSRANRRWNRDWDNEWEDDYNFSSDWKAGVNYKMNAQGVLVDPTAPANSVEDNNEDNDTYEYRRATDKTDTSAESIDKQIRELERRRDEQIRRNQQQYREDRRRMEEQKPAAPSAPAPEARMRYAPVPDAMESLVL